MNERAEIVKHGLRMLAKAPKAVKDDKAADRLERHAFYQINRLLELERGVKQ